MHTLVSIWCCFIVILTTLQIINWMFWGVVVHGFSFLTFIDTCTYYTCFCWIRLALDIQWVSFDQICNKTKCLYAVWCCASSECWVMKREKEKIGIECVFITILTCYRVNVKWAIIQHLCKSTDINGIKLADILNVKPQPTSEFNVFYLPILLFMGTNSHFIHRMQFESFENGCYTFFRKCWKKS